MPLRVFDYVIKRAEEWLVKPEAKYQIGRLAMNAMGSLQLNGLMQFALNAVLGYVTEDKVGEFIQRSVLPKLWELPLNALSLRIRAELEVLLSNRAFLSLLNEWKRSCWSGFWKKTIHESES